MTTHRLAATLAAALLLAGCTSAPAAPAQLTLRQACDELAPIAKEFGKVQPDAARFATYAPKVRAVVDRSDEAARKTLEPYAAAFAGGNIWELAGASIGTKGICKAAGSTVWG